MSNKILQHISLLFRKKINLTVVVNYVHFYNVMSHSIIDYGNNKIRQ